MVDKRYFVYILASRRNGTLYVGVTGDLAGRVERHKKKEGAKFTTEYRVGRLVYYEVYRYVKDAINREKQLKKWRRAWKLRLIEKENPDWRDLFEDVVG